MEYLPEAKMTPPRKDEKYHSQELNHKSSPDSYPNHHDGKKIVYDGLVGYVMTRC